MSILIKGMEMPKNCDSCPCYYETEGAWRNECEVLQREHYITDERPDWCPLVPVPEHGDLIDRDALSKSLNALCDRVCQYSKAQRKVMCGACPLGDAFAVVEDDAPTIIEAEEGET